MVADDFYTVDLGATFDFIYYWDGFGIGSDADQRVLLQRIAHDWLTPNGRAILDVFSPWNWARRHGETSEYAAQDGSTWIRTVRFDAVGNRLVDAWHPADDPDTTRSQTIRCYAIPELVMLLEGTGLRLDTIRAMDGTVIDLTTTSETVSRQLTETNGYVAVVRKD